jgi:hypothetical protein
MNAVELAADVFRDHVAVFPNAVDVVRADPAAGIQPHNPMEAFVQCLCAGVVSAFAQAPLFVAYSGKDGGSRDDAYSAFTLLRTEPAVDAFLTASGWSGGWSRAVAGVLVGSVLERIAARAHLHFPGAASGSGQGSALVYNPDTSAVESALQSTLRAAFLADGRFYEGDVEANGLSQVLEDQLDAYARGYAEGLGLVYAEVSISGSSSGSTTTTDIPAWVV